MYEYHAEDIRSITIQFFLYRLRAEMIGKIGGYKRIINQDNPTEAESRTIRGQEESSYAQYKFDFRAPFHCSERDTCESEGDAPVDFGDGGDVRRVSQCMHTRSFSQILSRTYIQYTKTCFITQYLNNDDGIITQYLNNDDGIITQYLNNDDGRVDIVINVPLVEISLAYHVGGYVARLAQGIILSGLLLNTEYFAPRSRNMNCRSQSDAKRHVHVHLVMCAPLSQSPIYIVTS